MKNSVHKKLIELRAMKLATEYMESLGYSWDDTSANRPYDLLCSNSEKQLKVEVKGTSCLGSNTIFMTRNEVELHRSEKGNTALIIVSGITIASDNGNEVAIGGELEYFEGWDIDDAEIIPISYKVSLQN